MFFDTLMKWMAEGFSTRSRTPAALAADPSILIEDPAPIWTLAEWLGGERDRPTPPKAVAFLEVCDGAALATIVDAGHQRVAGCVRLSSGELEPFSTAFLRTSPEGGARSILFAPFAATSLSAQLATPAKTDKTKPPPTTDGVTPIGEKPPEPPKFQVVVLRPCCDSLAACPLTP
ncbi:MAG: hypothetical protein R3B48_04000 [Kofleriaceae bacterium]